MHETWEIFTQAWKCWGTCHDMEPLKKQLLESLICSSAPLMDMHTAPACSEQAFQAVLLFFSLPFKENTSDISPGSNLGQLRDLAKPAPGDQELLFSASSKKSLP